MSNVLTIRGLSKRFPGMEEAAVRDLSFHVDEGEVLALVGESGSGKTTLLRMIAGLERPTSGEIEIGGRLVQGPKKSLPPEKRGVGLVFQDYALFPHLTVVENIAYGLRIRGRRKREGRAWEVLELVGLTDHAQKYPHELSGGQQQRVALARALAPEPTIVLLDEPFSNLDAALKGRLRNEIGDLIRRTKTTAIFVLHDSEDALALGDRIAIMKHGTIWQEGTPQMVYARPRDGYVARFFGETNLIPARCSTYGYETPLGFHPAPAPNGRPGPVTIALYPEELELSEVEIEGAARATVLRSIFRGSHQQITVRVENGFHNGEAPKGPNDRPTVDLQVYLEGCWPLNPGTPVHIRIRSTATARILEEPGAYWEVVRGKAKKTS